MLSSSHWWQLVDDQCHSQLCQHTWARDHSTGHDDTWDDWDPGPCTRGHMSLSLSTCRCHHLQQLSHGQHRAFHMNLILLNNVLVLEHFILHWIHCCYYCIYLIKLFGKPALALLSPTVSRNDVSLNISDIFSFVRLSSQTENISKFWTCHCQTQMSAATVTQCNV